MYYISFTSRRQPAYFIAQGVDILSTRQNKYSIRYLARCAEEDLREIYEVCKRNGRNVTAYPEAYHRNSGYRRAFFAAYPKKIYRCRYCNRRLTRDQVTVDHVIAVSQAQLSARARRRLQQKGIADVNDLRNLVPACSRCNRRKADKGGIWLIKAWMGQYRAYWMIRYALITALLVLIILYRAEILAFLQSGTMLRTAVFMLRRIG